MRFHTKFKSNNFFIFSEMIPEFETGEFVLLNFTQHQQRAAPVYSEPVHGGGQTWRLKVYPVGYVFLSEM